MKRFLICASFVLLSTKGWSAVAVSSSTFVQTLTNDVITGTVNCQGGNLLVMECVSGNGWDVLNSSYSGTAMTFSTRTVDGGGPTSANIFYLVNPAAGSNTLSASFHGVSSNQGCFAACFTGANTSTPIDKANCDISGGGGTVQSSSMTTTVANDLILDVILNNNTNALTAGSQQTVLVAQAASLGGGIGNISTKGPLATGANVTSYTASLISQPVMCSVAIEPSAAVASSTQGQFRTTAGQGSLSTKSGQGQLRIQ